MLDDLIFISNSIPKSGSTLLFNLQRDFLLSLSGRRKCDYTPLEEAGVKHVGGFLPASELPKLMAALAGGLTPNGPLALKTHLPISPALRAHYATSDKMFISMIVRDPLDALMSAMENHRRTGEFVQFDTIENGCQAVNNFFRSIYDSTLEAKEKPIPLVHYTDLKDDPAGTLLASFHPDLLDRILRSIVARSLDIEATGKKAKHRLQSGARTRDISDIPADRQDFVLEQLSAFRAKLGYTG